MDKTEIKDLSLMKYALDYIVLPSEWFNNRKNGRYINSKYHKMGYKGLFLLLSMYKFRIHRQGKDNQHVFVTSIELLQNEMQTVSLNDDYTVSYSRKPNSKEVFELLKTLVSLDVITIVNIKDTKLRPLKNEDGSIKVSKSLIINTNYNLDTQPPVHYSKDKEVSCRDDESYVFIHSSVFELMRKIGLNEKYYALYIILKTWSIEEGYCYIGREKLSEVFGCNKKTISKMLLELQEEGIITIVDVGKDREGRTLHHYYLSQSSNKDLEDNDCD